MLTKTQEKVLSALLSLNDFSMSALSSNTDISTDGLDEILLELFHLDYLQQLVRNGKQEITSVSLSALGKHYFEHKHINKRRQCVEWLKGFVTGIAASLIASYLYGLFC